MRGRAVGFFAVGLLHRSRDERRRELCGRQGSRSAA
jgi:hypothetical protein